MNERIKEIFKRAGGKTSIHNLMSNPIQHREYNELWDDNINKFANLIIDMCAEHILTSSDRYRKEYFAAKVLELKNVER